MSIQISNRRNQIRRSTVTGIAPTIPSTGVTSQIYPDNTWANTDIMVGELFLNTVDSRVWFRDDVGIHELGYSGQTGNFLSLSDTPNSYSSFGAGSLLGINSAQTALEWVSGFTDTNTIQGMNDWYYGQVSTGETGYAVTVDASGSGFTVTSINQDFTGLDDVSGSYSTQNDMVRVNSALTGLEFFDPTDTFVTLDTIQTINSAKTFEEATTFNSGIVVYDTIQFSGLTTNVTINEIMTDTGFTAVNDQTIPTSSAVYYWVNSLIVGTGITSTYVTLNTTQTITGTKTFGATLTTTKNLLTDKLECQTGFEVSGGDVNLDPATYQYWGDSTSDGSYRIFINVKGDLTVEKRVAGSWIFKAFF